MSNVNLIYSHSDEKNLNLSHEVLLQVVRFSCSGFAFALISEQKLLKTNCYVFLSEKISDREKLDLIQQYANDFFTEKVSHFIFQTPINTQIPKVLFSVEMQEKAKTILVEDVDSYHFELENLPNHDFYNMVAWNKELYNQIKTAFPQAKIISHASVLLNMFNTLQNDILIFFDTRQFVVLCKNNAKFLGMNTFHFDNEADCCFYLLAFIRKCFQQSIEGLVPILCGNISTTSPLYKTLSRYFSQIDMMTKDNMKSYSLYCDVLCI